MKAAVDWAAILLCLAIATAVAGAAYTFVHAVVRSRRVPVSQDPPAREPIRQRNGEPRIKVLGLADRVWADTVARTHDFRVLADS